MYRSLVATLTLAGILLVGSSVASASVVATISDTDFDNPALVGVANGTYVAGSPGYMHLSFSTPADDAVVGAKGPFGLLRNLNMSFTYSNLVGGSGNEPYAAFGVSSNGVWDSSGQRYMVIAMSGDELNASTGIHVFDVNTQSDAGVAWGTSLGDILNTAAPSGGLEFGDFEVMRAYAYIGNWPNVGDTSVDINSITVTAVPEPSTMLLTGGALFGLMALRRRKFGPQASA